MAKLIELSCGQTYRTRERAMQAAQKAFPDMSLRYFLARNEEGRWYPVFVGMDCIRWGVHFCFPVVG